MNKGTRIRTVLGILTTINTILAVTDVTQFGNDKLTFVYKIVSVVVNAVVVGINTYYNNDYSEEACIGTGITRQLKAEKEEGYVGDSFYSIEGEPNETLGIEIENTDDFIENIKEEIGDEDE